MSCNWPNTRGLRCHATDQTTEVHSSTTLWYHLIMKRAQSLCKEVLWITKEKEATTSMSTTSSAHAAVRECTKEYVRGFSGCCPSSSWWAIFTLAREEDETIRFCIDYCKLNDVFSMDGYPVRHLSVHKPKFIYSAHSSLPDTPLLQTVAEDKVKRNFHIPRCLL